jgi:hypothetical protein
VSFVPPVFNYTTHNYRAGNQNWAVAQGRDRVIYVGNEHGLLSFDGVNWQLNPLPNHLSVKSLFIDHTSPEERIYVGSFEEFGYFQKNGKNELCYHSLKPLIREFTLYNDEVWTIHKLGSKLFFQTFSSYFVYDESDNTLKTEKPFPAPLYFFKAGEELYAQFIDDHFYRYDGKQFQLLLTRERLNNDHVVSVLLFNNILLLTTERSGIFSLDPATGELIRLATEVDRELQSETVNRVTRLSDSVMVIGTLKHGLYALRTDGTLLWQLNRNNGLYNNTILGLFTDDDSNLWAALDNGISHIRTHSPLSFFEPKNIHIGIALQQMGIYFDNLLLQVKLFADPSKNHVVVIVCRIILYSFPEKIQRPFFLLQAAVVSPQFHQNRGVGGVDRITVLEQIERLGILSLGFGIDRFVKVVVELSPGSLVQDQAHFLRKEFARKKQEQYDDAACISVVFHYSRCDLFPPCVSKTTGTPLRLIQVVHLLPFHPGMLCNHHLTDTFTVADNEVFIRQVDQNHTYLSTVIGIDRPWGIDDGDTMFNCQTTPGSDLGFIPFRKLYMDPGRNQCPLQRLQGDRTVDIGP